MWLPHLGYLMGTDIIEGTRNGGAELNKKLWGLWHFNVALVAAVIVVATDANNFTWRINGRQETQVGLDILNIHIFGTFHQTFHTIFLVYKAEHVWRGTRFAGQFNHFGAVFGHHAEALVGVASTHILHKAAFWNIEVAVVDGFDLL